MATNLALDDRLVEEALRVGGRTTKNDTVTEALQVGCAGALRRNASDHTEVSTRKPPILISRCMRA